MSAFTFQGRTFNYFDHPHNHTRINERAVELPLVKYFLDKYPDCVEIGAVSPYYFEGEHEIYDLTDSHVRSKSARAEDINVAGRNLLSISTIEHCQVPDTYCSDDDPTMAPAILDRWINTAKNYLISWPMGYAPFLDRSAVEKYDCKFISRRPQNSHNWEQVFGFDKLDENDKRYGSYHCASTVIVLENVF